MKTIVIERGGNTKPIRTKKGDLYDSVTMVYEENYVIGTFLHTNTDRSLNSQGGILAEGSYKWICGNRADTGAKVLFLYRATPERDKLILKASDLGEWERVLPSLTPNPNHNGKMVISQVLIHSGGYQGDLSLGCITLYPDTWMGFIRLFEIGEKGKLQLTRNPRWLPTGIYPK